MEINNINNPGIEMSNIDKKEKLKDLCTQFESFFYHMILKAGRSSSIESDLVEKSRGEEVFTEMFDRKVSEIAAENTQGGLKEILFDYLQQKLPDNKTEHGKKFPGKMNEHSKKGNFYTNIQQNRTESIGIDIAS
jgi:Rod binding domain-containing protein